MAFSTSMGTVTNIAIQKVEAAVVLAAAVRVGGVERKGREMQVVAEGVLQRRSESPSARALHLVSQLTCSPLHLILSWCKYPCDRSLCSSANYMHWMLTLKWSLWPYWYRKPCVTKNGAPLHRLDEKCCVEPKSVKICYDCFLQSKQKQWSWIWISNTTLKLLACNNKCHVAKEIYKHITNYSRH